MRWCARTSWFSVLAPVSLLTTKRGRPMKSPYRKIFPPLFALFLLFVPLLSQPTDSQTARVTEEEVRQFLEQYKNHYTRKDIDGFISLFSFKAIQNERDGFNDIRKIYSDFFNQSKELRYHLEDMKIEIYKEALIFGLFYETAISVAAHYTVDQILKKTGKKKVWEGDIRWILIKEHGTLRILTLDFKHQISL